MYIIDCKQIDELSFLVAMKKRIIMVHVHVFSWSVGVATWENVICFRQARRIIVWSGDEAGKAQSGGEGHAGSEGNRSVPGGGRACGPDGAGPAQPWQPGRGSQAQTAAGYWAFGSVSHWPWVSVRSTIRCWKEIFLYVRDYLAPKTSGCTICAG